MNRSQRLARRIREVFLDGKWIAHTNFREQLSGLNREQAIKRVGGANSIADLTYHINYYLAGVLQVLEGGPLAIRDRYSFDRPPMESEEDWSQLRQSLLTNAERFAARLETMPDDQLDRVFEKEAYGTYQRNIEGVIEHAYYHLGQISLLRKWPSP